MAPTIHCVRHAQGYHNISIANENLRDPLLTDQGKQQCEELRKRFPYSADIELVVASPLRRTIYTALYAFRDVLAAKKLRIIALPELQETSSQPCDTGSSVEDLAREFAAAPVDLSLVKDGWNSKTGRWAPDADVIEKRALNARRWLMSRDEKNIVVVSHGGFLHYFTEDWTGAHKFYGTGWGNCEFRTFTFNASTGGKASITETDQSKRLRSGTEKPLTGAEELNLEETSKVALNTSDYGKLNPS